MLYVDGPRVYHELSRKFYWSNMIDQIKMICKACEPCQTTKVRRTCSSNELLQNKGTEAFHKWTKPMNGAKISPKSLDGEHEIDTLCLNSIHKLMEDSASRKKPSLRDTCAQKRAQTNNVSQEAKQSSPI
jgi:Integrase zinc binding domain